MSKQPALEYAHGPCPQCGAASAGAAETVCKATQGIDGDYHCAADSGIEDSEGRFMFPTPASLQALEDWYQVEGMKDDAAAR